MEDLRKVGGVIMRIAIFLLILTGLSFPSARAELGTYGSLGEEQAQEKFELENMRKEMNDIRSTTNEAIQALNQINTQELKQPAQEMHLFCKEATCEISPGNRISCLTYNGHLPGPTIVVQEGQMLKVVLHNQMKVPTSLHFHGMALPHSIDGLPKTDAGLVKPGESYAYQFIAQPKGTYWYHPQIIHADQKAKGLAGAIVVEPVGARGAKTFDREVVIVFGELLASTSRATAGDAGKVLTAVAPTNQLSDRNGITAYYLINGQSAPAVPAIELTAGSRVRIRMINAAQDEIPVHLSGHRFEVVSINGDLIQTQTPRDTITLGVSDRVDIEFTANNPGLWSLASEKVEQTTTGGKFPGGIACVVRYTEK